MSKSVGERAKQEAEALKARTLDIGLRAMTQGACVSDVNVHTGKQLKMGVFRRTKRVENMEQRAESNERSEAASDKKHEAEHQKRLNDDDPYNDAPKVNYSDDVWSEVTGVSLVGADMEEEEISALLERLHMLEAQIPETFDLHDESVFNRLQNVAVPQQYAVLFEKLYAHERERYAAPFHAP